MKELDEPFLVSHHIKQATCCISVPLASKPRLECLYALQIRLHVT